MKNIAIIANLNSPHGIDSLHFCVDQLRRIYPGVSVDSYSLDDANDFSNGSGWLDYDMILLLDVLPESLCLRNDLKGRLKQVHIKGYFEAIESRILTSIGIAR